MIYNEGMIMNLKNTEVLLVDKFIYTFRKIKNFLYINFNWHNTIY